MILTIDAGTTNLRLRLYNENKKLVDNLKSPFGVSVGKKIFIENLENAVKEILTKNSLEVKNTKIIASGMITSQMGLYETPHLEFSVGKEDLKKNIKIIEFLGGKINLITGVKHKYTQDNLVAFDVMRGEETEIIGILENLENKNGLVILMPGSHNKIVEVSKNNKIISFVSTLSGELLSALMGHTILKNSLQEYPKNLSISYLNLGFENCIKTGLTQSSFYLRCLDLHNELTIEDKFSYLLGTILQEDINSINSSIINYDKKILILGDSIISKGLEILLQQKTKFKTIERIKAGDMSSIGAMNII